MLSAGRPLETPASCLVPADTLGGGDILDGAYTGLGQP